MQGDGMHVGFDKDRKNIVGAIAPFAREHENVVSASAS
jgi:hypothetical protein